MIKKIFFHGHLKELLPEPVEIDASSPLEAMRGLVHKYPHLSKFASFGDRSTVQIVGFEGRQSLTAVTDVVELHVVPAMHGSGGSGGGVTKIVIGALIIVAAVLTYGASLGVSGVAGASAMFGTAMTTTAGSAMIMFGSSMILSGVLSFLSPAPARDTGLNAAADPEASKYLGVGQNTVRIGTRIPIAYGLIRAWGHFISFDIQAKDVAV